MKESATYQAIIEEGKALGIPLGKQQGLKEALLRLGTRRFGPPDTRTSAALQAVADLAELERLEDRLLDVSSWQELLAGSAAAPAKGSSNPTP